MLSSLLFVFCIVVIWIYYINWVPCRLSNSSIGCWFDCWQGQQELVLSEVVLYILICISIFTWWWRWVMSVVFCWFTLWPTCQSTLNGYQKYTYEHHLISHKAFSQEESVDPSLWRHSDQVACPVYGHSMATLIETNFQRDTMNNYFLSYIILLTVKCIY